MLEAGATSRAVLLPEGAWFELATGVRREGGGRIDVQAPLDVTPVFARGGAVIPRWNVQQYVGEGVQALELLACVVPGVHRSLLYEDDGVTRGGPYRVSRFVLDGAELRRTVAEGAYQPPVTQVRVVSLERGSSRELNAPADFAVTLG